MASPQVTGGVLPLDGDLTWETVGTWFRKLAAMWGGSASPRTIDLAGTERVDSAGLALLLEWKARAQDRNEALSLINPPEHLLRLAALGEATELLGLVGESSPEGGTP